jgi:hypothetical protein
VRRAYVAPAVTLDVDVFQLAAFIERCKSGDR